MTQTTIQMPAGLDELLELERAGWVERHARMLKTARFTNDRHPLLATVEQIDGELKSLGEEHATKFRAAQAAEVQVAEAKARGEEIGTDHAAFVAMDEAGKAAGDLADKIAQQEIVKARLVQQMGASGITPAGEGNTDRDGYMADLERLRGVMGANGQVETPGMRLTKGELYQEAVKSGRLMHSEWAEKRIALGESLDREGLKSALITGAADASAGAFIAPQRIGYFDALPLRPLTILDLITIGQTDSDLIEYIRMLSMTNAAAPVPEAITAGDIGVGGVTAIQAGLKPESAMTFQTVQEAVRTLAHWVPATKRALADAGQLRTIIDGVLRWGLGDVVERQVVAGNGIGDNLLGLLEQTGTNSIPAGASSHADKIHKGKTQIQLDGFNATGILMNPLDAEVIWLSRDNSGGAGTGGYLFGNPNAMGPRTLWGMPVAESAAVPQGTAIVGALQAAILWLREGTQVMASDSHKDWFTRNMVAILAEMRAGFGVPTPSAFCEVNLAAV